MRSFPRGTKKGEIKGRRKVTRGRGRAREKKKEEDCIRDRTRGSIRREALQEEQNRREMKGR